MKILKWSVLTLLTVFILYLLFHVIFIYLANAKAQQLISDFSPSTRQLSDGYYYGEFIYGGFIKNQVSFRILNGRLSYLQFDKLYGTPGYGAPGEVIRSIEENNDLAADAVSGATITSHFARAAIRDAVLKGSYKK